jgi:uncharacterized protein (DUF1501 family)
LIGANLGTDIYVTGLGSFDTHANQAGDHARLLQWLSDGLAAFHQDVVAHGRGDDVVVMTFSEFGRRVNENESFGTDHGTAAPLFVLGNAVSGGIYGDHPSLVTLDDNYDLIHEIDFRSVYATVLRHWLQVEPESILGSAFRTSGSVGRPDAAYSVLGDSVRFQTLPHRDSEAQRLRGSTAAGLLSSGVATVSQLRAGQGVSDGPRDLVVL